MGSLIRAMVHTRPDIAHAVSLLSRATTKPELWHYNAAQHLILYLRETRDLGIIYDQQKMWDHEARVTAATDPRFDPYFEPPPAHLSLMTKKHTDRQAGLWYGSRVLLLSGSANDNRSSRYPPWKVSMWRQVGVFSQPVLCTSSYAS